ncbi:MAG: Pycsar system effector family protein [Candidatus Hodarchaeales archaeon]|jgi:hypothetical protein
MKEKIEVQKKNYEWLLNSINSADIKAGYLIGLDLAIIGLFASQYDDLISKSYSLKCWFFITMLLIFAISILISLFSVVRAIIPRINKEKKSIFYFKSINMIEENEYNNQVISMTEEEIIRDLNNQISVISKITESKFNYVKIGFISFIIALITFLWIFIIN